MQHFMKNFTLHTANLIVTITEKYPFNVIESIKDISLEYRMSEISWPSFSNMQLAGPLMCNF